MSSVVPDAPALVPFNTEVSDASESAINTAVEYAFSNGATYTSYLLTDPSELDGKSVLEVGPGGDFGMVLFMACFGAAVAVADRWLAEWQNGYHGPIYSRLADKIAAAYPGADVTPLRRLAEADRYLPDVIRLIPERAEQLGGVEDEAFDIIVSNAVFEHVPDMSAAARRFAQVTRPGGLHLHQIDLRDHRDFEHPLEYLLMPEDEVEEYLRATDYHSGSPRRASEYEAAFKNAGFEVLSTCPTVLVGPAYLDDVLERLRKVEGSRYRAWPCEDLEYLGMQYILRRR
jgi:SAM-dependent methyltransferase